MLRFTLSAEDSAGTEVGVVSFMARHGHYFVDWVFDAIDLATKEHEVVYL